MPFDLRQFHPSHLSEGQRESILRAVVAISLANLCYLRVWDALFNSSGSYFLMQPYTEEHFVAALVGMFLLATLLYFLIALLWRAKQRWIRGAAMLVVLLFFLIPLDFATRSSEQLLVKYAGLTRPQIVASASGMLLLTSLLFRQRFYAVLFWTIAVVSPYAAINVASVAAKLTSAWRAEPALQHELALQQPPPAARTDGARQRVVWILFDEWDQGAISGKIPGVVLPTVEALKRTAVVATRAHSPAGSTLLSVPSLLTGRVVEKSSPHGTSEILIQHAGSETAVSLRDDNVIKRIVERNGRVAMLGWYHPYDRLFQSRGAVWAKSWGFAKLDEATEGLLSAIASQWIFLVDPTYGRRLLAKRFEAMHAAAIKAIRDPSYDLVFLHYGIPHLPGIFDPATGKVSGRPSGDAVGYRNNLFLVDRALAEIMAEIAVSSRGPSTAVIATSDHWWRSSPWSKTDADYRIPLIIVPPVKSAGLDYEQDLCTVNIANLVEEMIEGRVKNAVEVKQWLNTHRVPAPEGYTNGVARWPRSVPHR